VRRLRVARSTRFAEGREEKKAAGGSERAREGCSELQSGRRVPLFAISASVVAFSPRDGGVGVAVGVADTRPI